MSDTPHHSLIEDIRGIAFGVCMGAVGIQIMTHRGFITGQTTGLAALITCLTGLPFLWLGHRRMAPPQTTAATAISLPDAAGAKGSAGLSAASGLRPRQS